MTEKINGVGHTTAAAGSGASAKTEKKEKPIEIKFVVEKNTAKAGKQVRNWHSPSGMYPAFVDGHSTVKGITHQLLLNSENRTDGQRSSAAMYTMNTILDTKMTGVLNNESKAKLLAFIIKKNPSVFDKRTGRLKDGADVTRLDIPTKEKIAQLCGVKYNADGKAIKQKETTGAVINNFGYNAKQDASGKYHYYRPNGQEITPDQFKAASPNLYKQLNP